MRFLAALFLFGTPWFCEKRVAVEAQPPERSKLQQYEVPCRRADGAPGFLTAFGTTECRHVVEIYRRIDGAQYAKESDECENDYLMQGSCS